MGSSEVDYDTDTTLVGLEDADMVVFIAAIATILSILFLLTMAAYLWCANPANKRPKSSFRAIFVARANE